MLWLVRRDDEQPAWQTLDATSALVFGRVVLQFWLESRKSSPRVWHKYHSHNGWKVVEGRKEGKQMYLRDR